MRHLGAMILTALLLAAGNGRADADMTLNGPGDLAGALEAAKDGGVLRLAGGDWGGLSLQKTSWPDGQPLVLTAADPSDPPRFSSMGLSGVHNVVLDGILFDYTFTPGDARHYRPFRISGSEGIVVRNGVFDGDVAQDDDPSLDGFPAGFGLSVTGSSDVTLEDNIIRGFARGLLVSRSRGITIQRNDVHDIRSDGMDFAQVQQVLIQGNHIHDFARSATSKDHADMIQFWTNRTDAPSEDIQIRGNLLNSGRGLFTQSIFMRNEQVDRGRAGPEMFYRNVTIEGNFILNAHLHGITVGQATGLSILNNTVVQNPTSKGEKDNTALWTPQIRVTPESTNVRVMGNVVSKIVGAEDQRDWTVADNLFVQGRTRMEPGFYGAVFVGGDPVNPASFLPKPGGPLDGTGIGAPLMVLAR
ncbi:right-handed parallel beta-helix repeat-containing protein [Rubellimicrobium arenae]|uniref:right-handed parallel beta-helix repeat-containing protein n=1 Tax=Rubellimicrobium arenae TaxID=2817372 RepID=UPI001B30CE38|nr:right-handed parallel beta-helix repeat-containing protein [Rubellimicrobium arenae]